MGLNALNIEFELLHQIYYKTPSSLFSLSKVFEDYVLLGKFSAFNGRIKS